MKTYKQRKPRFLYVFGVAESESGVCLTLSGQNQAHFKANFDLLNENALLTAYFERAR